MSDAPAANASPVLDLKSAALTLVAVVVKSTDLGALGHELERRFRDAPGLFDNDPVVVDLTSIAESAEPVPDFLGLIALLRSHRMLPIGARGGSQAQMEAARAAGLPDAPVAAPRMPLAPPAEIVLTEVIREVQTPPRQTLIIDKPVRSGQQIYAKDADLVLMAAVNFGAEVIADGNVHVYAPLRGRAVAGARGNIGARIFSTCMEPQLVSIAGTYRNFDAALAVDVAGKPAQVRLDGDRLVIEPLKP